MARKQQKRTEPEIIVVKILFALGGAIFGAIFTCVLGGRLFWLLELSLSTQIIFVLWGALAGAIVGWLWANREVWSD